MITVISEISNIQNIHFVNSSRVAQSCLFKLRGRIVPPHNKARFSQPTFEGGINSVLVISVI
jgi:hypothetical protein